jgi:hypothetical protein
LGWGRGDQVIKKEADMAYEDLTDEDANALAEYLGSEKVAELQAQVEYEKLAQAQYELGQIMAQGFSDELEKQAERGPLGNALGALKMKARQTAALPAMAKLVARKGTESAHGARALKQLKKGLVLPGAAAAGLGAGAAALGAKKMYDSRKGESEKKSSDAEIYQALAVLAENDLI